MDKKATFINIRKVERGGETETERWKGIGREDLGGLLGRE